MKLIPVTHDLNLLKSDLVRSPGLRTRLSEGLLEQRLCENVSLSHHGCWLWTGRLSTGGYSQITNGTFTHRWSYQHFIGPIPKGMVVDHLCEVRHCVNPTHFAIVTQRENVLRGRGITAENVKKTHGKHGHLLEGWNVIIRTHKTKKLPYRICRECGLVRWRACYYAGRFTRQRVSA